MQRGDASLLEELFWDENSFSEILKSRDEFKLEEINYLNRSLQNLLLNA